MYASKEEPEIQRVWMPNNEHSPGLAMSRSFGDFLLKDYGVIAIPDISHHPLASSDQFIVLASDGVGDICRKECYVCMQDSKQKETVSSTLFIRVNHINYFIKLSKLFFWYIFHLYLALNT